MEAISETHDASSGKPKANQTPANNTTKVDNGLKHNEKNRPCLYAFQTCGEARGAGGRSLLWLLLTWSYPHVGSVNGRTAGCNSRRKTTEGGAPDPETFPTHRPMDGRVGDASLLEVASVWDDQGRQNFLDRIQTVVHILPKLGKC
ncbi:hypothetical protein Ddc_02014 [Ditylenchus destructor]|nr:hypothetical protein Ddc_02014 [Ditylenchus destructor]